MIRYQTSLKLKRRMKIYKDTDNFFLVTYNQSKSTDPT
jgi:hypothetical protein